MSMRSPGVFTSCLLTLALGFACKAPADDGSGGSGTAPDAPADDKEESPAASPFQGMPMGAMGKMLKKGLEEPGPYDEPKSSEGFDAEQPHWLAYELDGAFVELMGMSLFSGPGGTPLRRLTDTLSDAAANDEVQGLVLRIGGVGMSMAHAEELRSHLLAFKGEGKRKIVCHAEVLGNVSSYLASSCDELSLAPLGTVAIPGPATSLVHIKGMLDRLGLVADFLHVGAFKSGPEPLTKKAPSPESVQATQAIIDGAYERMVAGIAEGRGIDKAAAVTAVDEALFVPEAAKQAGLIDHIETYEAFRARATGDGAWTKLKLKRIGPDFEDPMALQRFLGILPPDLPTEPHVAVVYAVGNVIDGKGAGTVGANGEIASRPLSAALRAVAADDKITAVVLRVDSPGGSALASEQIHLATLELVTKKPMVVSMGSLAASGGYYISAGATKIFAQPDTLTGSIGVFGGKLAMGDALGKVGINNYPISRGKRGQVMSMMDPWNEGEREAIRTGMQLTYDRFLDRVAAGRKMEREAVHEVAQGRVWTGAEALERGLVDELGGLDQAIAAARELGKVAPETGLEFYPPEPTLKDLISSLEGGGSPLGVRASVLLEGFAPELVAPMTQWLGLLEAMQGSKVWAVSFVQPAR